MSEFTIEKLDDLVRRSAGFEEGSAITATVLDHSFADLGYDSLAMLELANRIERELGVSMPDEAVALLTTPRAAVDYVNGRLAEASV